MTTPENDGLGNHYRYSMPYPEINDQFKELRAGQIITDVPTLSAFNIVEQAICARLRPQGRHGEGRAAIASYEESICRKPIEKALRPKKFNGGLMGGQAIILPFDQQVAVSHVPRLEGSKVIQNAIGFTVLYCGSLRAAKVGSLGDMALAATYSTKVRTSFPRNDKINLVRRTLGKPSIEHEDIELLLEKRDAESSEISYRVRSFALRHLYPGGLPGSH